MPNHDPPSTYRSALRIALIEEDVCPECLADLSDERYCPKCNYDVMEDLDD